MGTPAISIIIPIYKKETTLARTLDSVLAQSFQDYEIILVDDGSPDRSGVIADEYATRHNNIIVVHQENRGPAEARKSGHHVAHGIYHMHLDSDDTLPSGALDFLYNKATTHDLDVIHAGFNQVRGEKVILRTRGYEEIIDGEELLRRLLKTSFHIYGGICFSKGEMWDDSMFPPAHMRVASEDTIFNYRLAMKARRVGLYDFPVYNYHENAQSLTAIGTYFGVEPMALFFAQARQALRMSNLPEQEWEQLLRIQEIHFVGFYVSNPDLSNPWIAAVAHYSTATMPLKYKVLQFLIRHPLIRRPAISANRAVKRLIGKG